MSRDAVAYLIATLGAVAPLAWLLFVSLAALGRVKELHHGYYGLALWLAPWWPVRLVGLVLLCDDTYQHAVEARALALGLPVPGDFTAIHRLGAWLVGRWSR